MTRSTTCLAIALLLAAPVHPALGAPAVPKPKRAQGKSADAEEREARAHFRRAERAFNVGKFDEALTAYQAAFEAKPLPAFVFNIAQCYRNLNDPDRALFFYRRYLALDPESPNARLVQSLIGEQEGKIKEREEAEEAARAAEAAAAPDLSARPEGADPVAGSLTRPAPPPEPDRPLHKRWWVWAAGGAVLAGTAAALLIKREGPPPTGGLGSVDFR